ncbi:MAG: HAD family hydrolase [Verrucomicrobia bacterium]|nr:HAD family hydrolase [Verrucomicrobiota bacterium]
MLNPADISQGGPLDCTVKPARYAPIAARRAVFLDRDGVINRPTVLDGKPYPPRSLEEFELLPGVADACARLKASGFLLVVVTNQPDVGRGTLERATVEAIHARMRRALPLDLVKACYHAGEKYGQPCSCRKPKPGMLLEAARTLGIDLANSYMVGDRWRDVDCGQRAGCHTVFIDWNYDESLQRAPDFRADSLWEATQLIIRTQNPAV